MPVSTPASRARLPLSYSWPMLSSPKAGCVFAAKDCLSKNVSSLLHVNCYYCSFGCEAFLLNHSRLEPHPHTIYDRYQALVRAGVGSSLMKRSNHYGNIKLKAHLRITAIGGFMNGGASFNLTLFSARSSTPCLKDKHKRGM
jgi:hypothetical protein